VRALTQISDALKVPAVDFVVPQLLHSLAVVLDNPKNQTSLESKAKKSADYTKAMEDLLSQIRDGEMFTITDSLAAGARANVVVPLQALYPNLAVGYNQSITFGAGIQGMTLRRTTLRRVHDELAGTNYLQVYVQSLDSVTGNLTVDFNLFIKILHLEAAKTTGKARSRV
jgi:hypothetical protein